MGTILTILHLGVILVLGWLFTWKAIPWAFVKLGRALGFRMRFTPVTAKRLHRFRRIRRGRWSFVTITTLFVISLFLELFVNGRALVVHYDGRTAFPAVAEWLDTWVPFVKISAFQKRSDFGQVGESEVDYRAFSRWSRDPDSLAREIEGQKADLARERAGWTAEHPSPAADAPDHVVKGYASEKRAAERGFDRRQTQVATLEKSLPVFRSSSAWCFMPLYPYGPSDLRLDLAKNPPNGPSLSLGIPLGTDFSGRDVVPLLLYAFRISLAFALLVSIIGYAIGIVVGALQGYYGGWTDIASQRFVEIWSSIPFLFVMMIIASMIQATLGLLIVLLVVLRAWIGITFYVRGEYLREKEKDYVQAAIGSGVRDRTILVRHIFPNSLVPIVTLAPFGIVTYIGTLVSLDYLGFGLPTGTPSWGGLLRQGLENVRFYPHLTIIPSAALALTLFAVVMIGEAVREAFDPRVFSRLR